MNKIHSPLGYPGLLNSSNVREQWETRKRKTGSSTVDCEVPVIREAIDSRAREIWERYFELLFFHLRLLDRFEKHANVLRNDAASFYDYMFCNGELSRVKLLDLLMGDPRRYADLITSPSEAEKEAIVKVFNYEYLSGRYHAELADFVQMLGVDVCPYCGRAFTTTVKQRSGGFIRTSQVDHYIPKSQRPWLALSIWNLVPSCGACNHRKKDNDDCVLYPYVEDAGDVYRFRTQPCGGLGYLVGARDSEEEFRVVLEPLYEPTKMDDHIERAEREVDLLGIGELYTSHNSYVSGIFRQRYVFGAPYIDDLVRTFPNLFRGRDDVLAMLSLRRLEDENLGSAPLDRLTRDIHQEIDQLTGEGPA